MFPQKQNKIPVFEQFGILAATWILACNDKNPIMTYKSVRQRLKLDMYNMEAIKTIIQSRGELFRKRVPKLYLKEWQAEMRSGKHLPTWMLEEDRSERAKLINDLGSDDVFISQFRADDEWPSSSSSTEIMDWGLQHIERLRKAKLEERDEIVRKWQLWVLIIVSVLNFGISIANIIISTSAQK